MDDELKPPSWDELREAGLMVVDRGGALIGLYCSDTGHAVLVSNFTNPDRPEIVVIESEHIQALIDALTKMKPEAIASSREYDAKCEREYAAHEASVAIESARKTGV